MEIRHAQNRTVDQTRLPSPAIWGDCPWQEINDPRSGFNGVTFFEDFAAFGLQATQTTEIAVGQFKLYSATAGIWAQDSMPHSSTPAGQGGIISGLCDTDGDAMSIALQANPFLLDTTNTASCLWFEMRIATTSILTNMGQIFCGLAETGVTTLSSSVPLGNADATSNALAMIGFNRLEDGLGVLNTSYSDHATSWTDVGTAANSTLAANTWIKLAMKIDFRATADPLRAVRFFVDNIECSSAMTKAALLALTHVDAKGLGPCLAFYADSAGTADYLYCDWMRVAQIF